MMIGFPALRRPHAGAGLAVILAMAALGATSALADTLTETSVLHQFTETQTSSSNSGALHASADGSVYGVRSRGGVNGSGELFRISASRQFTRQYSFPSTAGGSTTPRYPTALAEGGDGYLYIGARVPPYDSTAIVKASKDGTSVNAWMTAPQAIDPGGIQALVQGQDGALYGVGNIGYTSGGNAANYAQVFRVSSGGSWTQLHGYQDHQITRSNGAQPVLIPAPDGKLYGISTNGGPSSVADASGFIFSIDSAGTFKVEFTFRTSTRPQYGTGPVALALGADQKLYGVTQQGGWPASHNFVGGTFFRFTPGGAPEVLLVAGADNMLPPTGSGAMVRDALGRFYLHRGSASNEISRIDSEGKLEVLHPGYLTTDFDESAALGDHILSAAINANGLHVLTRYDAKGLSGVGRVTLLRPDLGTAVQTFTLSPSTLPSGSSTTLSWSSTGSSCAAVGDGAWRWSRPTTGSLTITPDLGLPSQSSYVPPPRTWVLGLACRVGANGMLTSSRSLHIVAAEGGNPGSGGEPQPGPEDAQVLQLTRGAARPISGAEDSVLEFYLDVPAGATNLSFRTSGGSGDLDLFVRRGQRVGNSPECTSQGFNNSEACDFASPAAGRYYVLVEGFEAYSGASLVAQYTTPSGSGDGDEGSSGGGGSTDALMLLLLLVTLHRYRRRGTVLPD